MGAIMAWFVAKGLGERAARFAAGAVAVIAIVAILWASWATWLHFHDKGVVAAERDRVDQLGSEGRETAAEEAAADSAVLAEQERRTHEAIDDAGATGAPDAAAVALGCDQLRRAGLAPPPECGSGSGDGSKAPAHR